LSGEESDGKDADLNIFLMYHLRIPTPVHIHFCECTMTKQYHYNSMG